MPIFNKVTSTGNIWGVDRWNFVAFGSIPAVIGGMLHEDNSFKLTEDGSRRVIE